MNNELDEPSMLPEYKKVLDTFGLKYTGNRCYRWNGYWLVSYYGDKNYCKWAVMKDICKDEFNHHPFTSLGVCEFMSPEELEKRISDMIIKYKQAKEEIKLENLHKDFK